MAMTLEDLRVSLQNFMPEWCEIERADNGEIIIYTQLVEAPNGELVSIDEAEKLDDGPSREQKDKIGQLLAAGDRLEAQLAKVALKLDRMRLTDAEREAIHWFSDHGRSPQHAATLRGLLERTKGGER